MTLALAITVRTWAGGNTECTADINLTVVDLKYFFQSLLIEFKNRNNGVRSPKKKF